jgi:hypothetical protein
MHKLGPQLNATESPSSPQGALICPQTTIIEKSSLMCNGHFYKSFQLNNYDVSMTYCSHFTLRNFKGRPGPEVKTSELIRCFSNISCCVLVIHKYWSKLIPLPPKRSLQQE